MRFNAWECARVPRPRACLLETILESRVRGAKPLGSMMTRPPRESIVTRGPFVNRSVNRFSPGACLPGFFRPCLLIHTQQRRTLPCLCRALARSPAGSMLWTCRRVASPIAPCASASSSPRCPGPTRPGPLERAAGVDAAATAPAGPPESAGQRSGLEAGGGRFIRETPRCNLGAARVHQGGSL